MVGGEVWKANYIGKIDKPFSVQKQLIHLTMIISVFYFSLFGKKIIAIKKSKINKWPVQNTTSMTPLI